MKNKIRWGILSTAKIGVEKVIPALQRSSLGEVIAIASRDPNKSQAAALQLGIPKAYLSYEKLLEDADIQAIYNPLPNHLHVYWTLKALEAGKHVLCEKPVALDANEANFLLCESQKYPNLRLMEAFMYRFHPQWVMAKQLVDEGRIGNLRSIQTFFSYFNDDPQNVRNQADIGGGGLMDIGCYPISVSRWLFRSEPVRVFGVLEFDPRFKTDRLTSGIMEFTNGSATFTISTQLMLYQVVNIIGDQGRIEIEISFNPPNDKPCKMWLHTNSRTGDGVHEVSIPVCDHYTLQGDAFCLSILEDSPVPTPFEDAVANMCVIDAIKSSSLAGKVINMDTFWRPQ